MCLNIVDKSSTNSFIHRLPCRIKSVSLRMTVKPSLSSLHSANSIGEPTREPLPDSVGANSSSGSASVKNNYQPIKAQRPKPVNQWTVYDVQKWLRKTCSEYYSNYSIKFLEQDITGEKGFDLEKYGRRSWLCIKLSWKNYERKKAKKCKQKK